MEQAGSFERRPIRQVIAWTARQRQVSNVLHAAVRRRRNGKLRPPCRPWRSPGKTGTARIATGGGYGDRRYAASFVGYTPVDDPQLVIMAKLEDPKGAVYGGLTAAPVTRAVVQAILATRGRGLIETGAGHAQQRLRLDWDAREEH